VNQISIKRDKSGVTTIILNGQQVEGVMGYSITAEDPLSIATVEIKFLTETLNVLLDETCDNTSGNVL